MKINPHKKLDYSCFYQMKTRWKDNDVYGHVNNVIYYEYFDTAVNLWLIENNLLNFKYSKELINQIINLKSIDKIIVAGSCFEIKNKR